MNFEAQDIVTYASLRDIVTHASLRVRGDNLDPAAITQIIGFNPTLSYKKDETYHLSNAERAYRGRTGVWLFSTERLALSNTVIDHLDYLLALLSPNVERLSEKVTQNNLHVDISVFWHGPKNKLPIVSEFITDSFNDLLRQIPAELVLDIGSDDDELPEPVSVSKYSHLSKCRATTQE